MARNRIRMTTGETTFQIVNAAFMLGMCFLMVYPFWYVLVYSLNETHDARAGGLWFWPRVFTLSNYQYVLTNPLLRNAYMVTIARTVTGSLLHLGVTGFAAYALSKRHLPGRKVITYFFVMPMFIGGTIVSAYVVMAKLGLLNNFLVYVLPGAFGFFMMAIIRAFIGELPMSLEESAKLDGAGYYTIFFRIILPLCMPIVATVLIFAGVGHWLDFYSNLLYVTRQELYTLQYLLFRIIRYAAAGDVTGGMAAQWMREAYQRERVTTQTLQMTTLIIVTVPILFIYPFFQKYFMKGILLGSIKE